MLLFVSGTMVNIGANRSDKRQALEGPCHFSWQVSSSTYDFNIRFFILINRFKLEESKSISNL